MPDTKQYLISLPGFEDLGRWDVQTYEKKKHELFKKYPDAQISEFSKYNADEEQGENDYYHVVLDGLEGEGVWDAKTFAEKKDKLFQKYPNAQVYRSRGVDYWYDKALADEESIKASKDEIDALKAEFAKQQRWSPEANALESQIIERQSALDALQAGYDANPRVVEAKAKYDAEYAAALEEYKKNYLPNLRSQIIQWQNEDVDMLAASKGAARKKLSGSPMMAGDPMGVMQAIDMLKGEDPATAFEANTMNEQYQSAQAFLAKAERLRESHSSFGEGIANVAMNQLEAWGSQSDMETYSEIYGILKRLEDKLGNLDDISEEELTQNLSKSEQALILAFFEYNAAQAEVQDSTGWAYKAGQIAGEAVPFILEFIATGGLTKAATKGATKGLSKALTSWIKNATKGSFRRTARKVVAKGVRGAAQGLTQAAMITPLRPTAYTNVTKAMTQIGEDGKLKDSGSDIAIAIADEYIETLSELSGGAITSVLGGLAKGTAKKFLSKSMYDTFATWGKRLAKTSGFKLLKSGQFHGLPVEVAEEYFGNALRELYDSKALDKMHEDGNFAAMLLGFAPLTVLGAGVGMGQYVNAKNRVNKGAERMRDKLVKDGFNDDQIDALIALEKELSPYSLAEKLDPVLTSMTKAGASKESRDAVIKYAMDVVRFKTLEGTVEAQESTKRQEKLDELTGKLGKFYQTKNEGTKWQENTVTQATLYDGRTVFLTSAKNEMGEFAAVDAETGETLPVSESDIALVENAETGESSLAVESQSLDTYLTALVMSERKTAEEKRMADERTTQVAALQERLKADVRLNIGTSDAPVYLAYLPEASNDGMAHFTMSDGSETILTWEQVGDYLNQPIRVFTDEQLAEAEAADIANEEARLRAENAETNEDMDKVEETVEDAEELEEEANPVHIPMNPDGTVNTDLFWDQNPEEWVKWNDEQKQDGGVDSMAQIAAGLQTAEAKLAEASKLPFATPTQREAKDKEMGFWQDKINRYNALLEQYQLAAAAQEAQMARAYAAERLEAAEAALADKMTQAPKRSDYRFTPQYMQAKQRFDAEVAALQEEVTRWQNELAQYGEMPVQQEETVPEENVPVAEEQQPEVVAPTAEELAAQLDAMLMSGASRSDEAVVAAMQAYADAIASGAPAKVVTRRNVLQVLKEAGVSETKIAEVKDALRRIQYIVNGFEANGVAYILADSVIISDNLRSTYVHERQHVMTAQSGIAGALMTMTSREELQSAIAKMVGSDFYSGKAHMVLADELISMAMERAYRGENLDELFERIGLRNENAINFIKSIDDAQRNDSGLSLARIAEIGGNAAEGGSRQDGRTSLSGSTEMGEQGPRSVGRGGETAGDNTSGRGVGFSVSPNEGVAAMIENENGEAIAETNGGGDVRFSVLTYEQGGRDYLVNWLRKSKYMSKEERDFIIATLDQQYELAKRLGEEFPAFGAWSSAEVNVDKDGNPVMSVIKANGDYSMNLDFSLICKKRRPLNALLDVMIADRMLDMRSLNEAEIAKINKVIQRHGFEVACALCFVDSKRYRVVKVATDFADLYNELVESLIPEGSGIEAVESNYAGYEYINERNAEKTGRRLETVPDAELNWAKVDEILEGVKTPKSVEEKVAWLLRNNPSQRKLVNATDFVTNLGFESVKKNNPELLKIYNAKKGTGGPKASFGDVQYLNDILKSKSFTPAKAYSVGGVRVQSFSDYMGHMFFDYMQMMAELAAKGLPAHAYTKEEAFVRIFGMTGMKINMSLVPAVADDGVAPGLDAQGNYVWAVPYTDENGNEIQGQTFPPEVAFELQRDPRYSKNVGIIAVGVSDEHILKMLNDDNIHFIIPYHKSSLNPEVAKMTKIDKYADYTNVQNTRLGWEYASLDKDQKKAELKKRAFDFYKSLAKTKDPKATAAEYLKHCRQNGLIPKYDQFSGHENYYKLLVDFNTYDFNTGEYAPQGPVTMTFPEELESLVRDSVASNEELESDLKDKVGKMAEDVKAELGGTRFSARTDEQRQALFDSAKAEYGVTDNFNIAGYMLPDGSLLNFADKDGEPDVRGIDHRNIGSIINDREYGSRWDYVTDFVNEGAIRIMPESNAVHLGTAPSAEQREKLLDYFYKNNGYMILELTDENGNNVGYMEYDEGTSPYRIMRDIDGYFNEGIVPEKDVRFSFIGERGAAALDKAEEATVRLDNLNIARQMEEAGKDAKAIRLATGWEKGADKLWRYEISDANFRLTDNWRQAKTLSEAIEHEELFEAYPEFKDINVELDADANRNNGSWNSKTNTIQVNATNEHNMRDSFIHEIQHAIQTKEGFARGSNVLEMAKRSGSDTFMLSSQTMQEMKDATVVAESLSDNVTVTELKEWIKSEEDKDTRRILTDIYVMMSEGATIQEVRHTYRLELNKARMALQKELTRADSPYSQYLRVMGEVEARNVSKRRLYDLERRRNTLISETEDIAREDQIFLGSALESAESALRFSIANSNQAILVSNAAKAVEGIKQEKATPAQWLAMIEKSGGLKAGEDKWMGLSDWLMASDKKTLTKQEVLDFIGEHMIQIEEVHYEQDAEDNVAELHYEIGDILQKKFIEYKQEFREANEGIDEYGDPAAEYAYQKLREEMDDTEGDIQKIGGYSVYVTFGYEDDAKMREWSEKLGLKYDPKAQIHNIRLGYTTDGLENRREIALTVPTIESWNESDITHFGDAGDGRAVAWIRFGDTQITEEGSLMEYEPKSDVEREIKNYIEYAMRNGDDFETSVGYAYNQITDAPQESVGWTEEAVTAVADGMRGKEKVRKVLVIDEIQSKRHQEGREKGYRVANIDKWLKDNNVEVIETGEFFEFIKDGQTDRRFSKGLMQYDIKKAKRLYVNGFAKTDVPDAPFDKNWHELAMKRMLRYAAENGYDVVAWTTGDQQADRYDLSRDVKKISASKPTKDGERIVNIYYRDEYNDFKNLVVDKEGKVVQGDYSGNALADVIGKEMALQIMKAEESTEFKGEGLKIGGEGMKGFYDKMLPAFMNKYGKKWGVKVEDIELPNLGEDGLTMHSVPVTEEMKASVMEGQVMFSITSISKEVQDEINVILAQSIVNGNYMKAPNGQPTKLTEDQWALVRTKSFVRWFGDWLKPKRIKKLLNSKPIEVKGDEFVGNYELNKKSAFRYIDETLAGTYVNKDSGDSIRVSHKGAKKVTSHGYHDPIHLASVMYIPRMIEDAIFITEELNDKGKNEFESYRYYVCGLKIGGEDYTAKIVAGVRGGETYYDHQLSSIEKGKLINSRDRVTTQLAEDKSALSEVKDTRLLSILKEDFSKVIDENGEPMVVYHGTGYEGNVFTSGFFASDEQFATDYGFAGNGFNSRVVSAFIKMVNPRVVDADYANYDEIKVGGQTLSADDLVRETKKDGVYDGLIIKNVDERNTDGFNWTDDIIPFAPSQIKSATETTGLFSESEDIRFSVGEAVVANTKEDSLPLTRKDAIARLKELRQKAIETNEDGLPYFVNDETGIKVFVSNADARHTMMYHNTDQFKVIGVYDRLIANAKFEKYDEVDPEEAETTEEVRKYVCPVILDGKQYIARMTIKKYKVGNYMLGEMHLYDTKLKDDNSAPDASSQKRIPILNSQLSSSKDKDTNNFETANETEQNVPFSVRTKPAPEKTGIGYKVFYLKDGKLYPPMVANLGGVDTPVGVWLDAEEGTRAGVSKTGRPKVKQGGKGTQGGSGTLAYRPGWHLGEIPYAIQFNRKDENGDRTLFPADFVWAEVEYADDVNYQEEAMSYGMNANGKFQHSLAGLPKLPTDGSYRYRTNPNPETDPWIITGAMKVNRLLSPSEVDNMVREAGREPQKRQDGAVTDEQINELNESLGLSVSADNTLFSATERSVDEIVNDGVQKVSEEGKKAKTSLKQRMDDIDSKLYYVMRMVAAAQKNYDKKTVDIMTNLAKELMRDGALSDPTRGEINRLLSAIKNATGKADLTAAATTLMDVMVSNQLRHAKNTLAQMLKIKAKKVNASGVEVQGTLDLVGQRLIATIKESIGLTLEKLDERIADAKEKMDSEFDTIKNNAAIDLVGLNIARKYVEGIVASEAEEKDLRKELESAQEDKKAGRMTAEGLREFRKATEDAIRQNRMERTSAYRSILSEMAKLITESVTKAGQFRDAEKERIEKIHHYANSDLQGLPAEAHKMKDSWFWNSTFVRFFLKSLSSFEQMLKQFGKKNAEGKGYLYNHFIPGWVEATNKEFAGTMDAFSQLDAKVREVFGGKVKRWSDLFSIEKKLPTMTVKFWDDGEMRTYELSQGNLLYIYMVNKMTDGKMKLRKMGITEEDVLAIYRNLDPRFIELAEWVQNDFLPSLRDKYNAVHERLFGAPMAAIDNYFPIRVLANARTREVEVGTPEGNSNPSTITGNIIKRTKNSLALDILGSDAFDVVLEHIQQMEHWAAFAEWNRDLNTLLSYKKFRNRVQNMSTVYGAGAKLWEEFRATAEIAAGVYRPKVSAMDKILNKIVRGLTAGKIGFRLWTAMKQILSAPAFAPYTSPATLIKNMAMPKASWDWAMENLEGFKKRWKSRDMGNVRLKKNATGIERWTDDWMDTMTGIGMTPNAFVDAMTCAIGAKSVYETAYAKYREQGYSTSEAEKKAKVDATVAFNTTQQSGEGAFLSSLQADRDMSSHLLTTYRNANFGMGRELFDAVRNLKHRMTPGYKEESIEFMTKQMMRDGLSETQAKRAAERTYRNGAFIDAARVVTFGFFMQFLWNMGNSIIYQLFGDDDEEKQKMMEDAAVRALFGPVENLVLGNVIIDGVMLAKEGELDKFNPSLSPAGQDLTRLLETLSTDPIAGVSDLVNIAFQIAIGTNPQVAADVAYAIYDACDGDMETSKEVGIALLRILQAPQSQIDKLIEDEIDFTKDKGLDLTIAEFARNYAEYKRKKNAPYSFFLYSDEEERKVEDRYIKRFTKRAEELKRTRGNETAKAWYDYVDNEYKEIDLTIRELRSGAEKAAKKEDRVSVEEFAAKMQELMQTPEFERYQQRAGKVKAVERLSQAMKDYPTKRDTLEDRMLEIRKQLVEEMQLAE